MCGICGKIRFTRSSIVSMEEIRNMSDVISYRGPDSEGFYLKGSIGLGFRRLSIIDLDTGYQPMSNEDGTIWLVFNGEIYNYKQLRNSLKRRGHKFQSQTDTEVIVHLYEEYGENCVDFLRGMFSFAIWDERKNQLFCARDRFGIKPFFYYHDGEKFIFASEIKSILKNSDLNTEICQEALDHYLTYGYTQPGQSIYSKIKKLKPAHSLTIDSNGKSHFKQYWQIRYDPDHQKTEEEWCELIQDKLSEAVKIRLMSDVPLGVFLSGGVDSSSIVAMMAQHSSQPIKTFSIGFAEEEYDELPFAREMAERYGAEHHEYIVEPDSIGLLPKLVSSYDEPFADSSAIPTYYLSKIARQEVTVALSGDGGDELFAGYKSYAKMKKLHDLNILPDFLKRYFWGSIHNFLGTGVPGKGLTYYLSQPRKTVAAYSSIWQLTERPKLYHPELWNAIDNNRAEMNMEKYLNNSSTSDLLFNMQQMDMHNYLVDDILAKVDRASMQNSLEVRVPMLDHELAELTFMIPSGLKLKGDIKKYILKKSMKDHLPKSIINHRKRGFGAPLKLWFKDELRDYIQDRLIHTKGPLYDYLNKKYVEKIIHDHLYGKRNLSQKIWSLLFLDEWLTQIKSGQKQTRTILKRS